MSKCGAWRGAVWVVTLVTCLGGSRFLSAGEALGTQAEALKHLEAGLRYYRLAEYDKARAEFDMVLKLKPDSNSALIMREKVGIDQLVKLLADDRYAALAHEILSKAAEAAERLQRDPATIRAHIALFNDPDLRKRHRAVHEIAAIGPPAVPYLLEYLEVSPEKPAAATTASDVANFRAGAAMALSEMGARAVPVLVEALKAENVGLRRQICAYLGRAGDIRALPALLKAAEDQTLPAELRAAASDAVRLIMAGKGKSAGTAAQAYLTLAEGYYYGDPVVTDYVPYLQRTIWTWDAAGQDYPTKLRFEDVPQYAYNQLMAEKVIYEGLEVKGAGLDLLGLLVANGYKQLLEARQVASGARAVGGRPGSEADRKEAAERAQRLQAKVHRLAQVLGIDALHVALYRALADNDDAVARECIAELRNLGPGRSPALAQAQSIKNAPGFALGNALIAALDSASPSVRFEATEALFATDPLGRLGGRERAVENAIRLMRSRVRPTVLIFTQDNDYHQHLARILSDMAIHAERGAEYIRVMMRLKEELPAVTALIMDARVTDVKPVTLVEAVQADLRCKFVPIIIAAPSADLEATRKAVAGRATVMAQGATREEVQKLLREMIGRPEAQGYATAEAEAVLLRLLNTLARVPPETRYPLRGAVPALCDILAWYPDSYRVPAARVLGAIGQSQALTPLMEIYLSRERSGIVRIVAGEAALEILAGGAALTEQHLTATRTMVAAEKIEVTAPTGEEAKGAPPVEEMATQLREIGARLIALNSVDVEVRRSLARDYLLNPRLTASTGAPASGKR